MPFVQSIKDTLAGTRTAVAVSAGTTGTGVSYCLDLIPSGIGKLATL